MKKVALLAVDLFIILFTLTLSQMDFDRKEDSISKVDVETLYEKDIYD